MSQEIIITSVTANTPVDIYYCDSTSGSCVYQATVSTFPYTFYVLPPYTNGNILINQVTSNLDYQLDVAVSHPSHSKDGYNGIVVNSIVSNVAADLTLQTSNTLGDGTQCILSMGSFGSNNKKALFQKFLEKVNL